jgi:anti-anti-sigma factor
MEMRVLETGEDWVHIGLSGRLDIAGVDEIESIFYAAFAPSSRHAVVDLSDVAFVSSMGIRMLVTGAKTAARRNRKLVLFGPTEVVKTAIVATGVDKIIPIVADKPAAMELLVPA